ncbi:hypothetical protein AB4Y36_10150 [Paraburkholderia sp. BR10936]|uniref:hypothetical protein n=1 Tax=Paraburkholderia sp. BR10936 TaxID=3236993 RepID=UPI0034D22065
MTGEQLTVTQIGNDGGGLPRPDSVEGAVEFIFAQFAGAFGFDALVSKFAGRGAGSELADAVLANMRIQWGDDIREAGFTWSEIQRGVKACKRARFVPVWGEFAEACRPAINPQAALYEAIEQMRKRQFGKDVWTNPAIFWAARKIGEHDMIQGSVTSLLPRFEAALAQVLASGKIQPVPERIMELPAPGAAESTREHGRKQLSNLGASGLLRPMKGGNRDWARRLLQRAKDYPEQVDANQIRIATEALAS